VAGAEIRGGGITVRTIRGGGWDPCVVDMRSQRDTSTRIGPDVKMKTENVHESR